MGESLQVQIENLRNSIQGLEAQRGILGDDIVNPALATLKQKLTHLEEQAVLQASPMEERRMVSILFFDMVGSTSIAEKLDPEEWRQVVVKVHEALGNAIATHHGTVAQYLGDGLLALFGSKQATENDPENAIRAALEAHTQVTHLPLNLPSAEKIQIRAGIHTGMVVVGDLGDETHKEFTASGDAMNLAARLQSAAPAGGTLISQDTYRYVKGVFDMTPQPPLTVKGKSEPIQTYLVRRIKPRLFRSLARGVAGVETRTVGREAEMQILQQAYLRAFEGHGTVWAQMLGDPGVGKSRLLLDMNDWMDLRDEIYRLLRGRAFPDDENQPFALVRRIWFDRFQIAEDAPRAQAEAKWVEHFREYYSQEEVEEAAQALGLLIGLQFEGSPYIQAVRNDPNQVKGRAYVVSRELVKAIRQTTPLVVLLEDLQWTDNASWDYLMEVFLDKAAEAQPNGLFLLATARPEWHPPEELISLFQNSLSAEGAENRWGVQVPLAPLTDQSTRELVEEIFQRVEDVPETLVDLLVERSEGIPYFTEELVNWFVDHEILDTRGEQWRFLPEKLKTQPLPATLQHLLLTRLSTLTQSERAALQRGAIFGRRFWSGGVEALGVSSGSIVLSHLQPRGFVEVQPESAFQGDTEWNFHHNLLQVVTYESVLKRERAELHRVAAEWLEHQASQAGRLEEFSGLLGDHYERAGELSTAANWYLRAGNHALQQGATHEASDFYKHTIELLPPVDRERVWQALSGLEYALMVLGEAESWKEALSKLIELAEQSDDDNQRAEAYFRQAIYAMTSADKPMLMQAAVIAREAARHCGNEAIEAKALILYAVAGLEAVDNASVIEQVEQALNLARSQEDKSALAFVLSRASYCYFQMGDFTHYVPLQEEQIELDHHLGNRGQEGIGFLNLGVNNLGMGRYKQSRSLLEQAFKIGEALDARRLMAYSLLNLSEVYLALGDLRKAHQICEQTLLLFSLTPDNRGKASAIITLGIVLLTIGDLPGAIRRLTDARELALNKGLTAKVTEATIILAYCVMMQGQLDAARATIYGAWEALKKDWTGIGSPMLLYRQAAEIFEALGETELFQEALEVGYREFMKVINTIKVPELRQSTIENVPDARAFMELYERSKQ